MLLLLTGFTLQVVICSCARLSPLPNCSEDFGINVVSTPPGCEIQILRHLSAGAGWLIRPYLVWDDDRRAAADSHDGQGRLSGQEVQDLRNFCHLTERQSPVKPGDGARFSQRFHRWQQLLQQVLVKCASSAPMGLCSAHFIK